MRARILAIAFWASLAAASAATTPERNSGIVVPLADAPFSQLVDNREHVAFAFNGNAGAQGWLTPAAAWLVWDPQWRGQVRSGADVIGQRSWDLVWRNGFDALRTLDANHDGVLTGDELQSLALWHDENNNGVSDPGEVVPANVHGIVSINLSGSRVRPGLIAAQDGVTFDNGQTRPIYDWTPPAAHVS